MEQNIKPTAENSLDTLETVQLKEAVELDKQNDQPVIQLANKNLIFWLKFEGVISYIGFGFCVLAGLISIITIFGIFTSLPFFVIGGAYSSYRARKHFKIANALKLNLSSDSILPDLKDIYKWSGIVNLISIIGTVLSIVAMIGVSALFYSGFNGNYKNDYKPTSSECEKAPYSIQCANTQKSQALDDKTNDDANDKMR